MAFIDILGNPNGSGEVDFRALFSQGQQQSQVLQKPQPRSKYTAFTTHIESNIWILNFCMG